MLNPPWTFAPGTVPGSGTHSNGQWLVWGAGETWNASCLTCTGVGPEHKGAVSSVHNSAEAAMAFAEA